MDKSRKAERPKMKAIVLCQSKMVDGQNVSDCAHDRLSLREQRVPLCPN